jgi:xanthine dehydrogenase accessory factor
MNTICQKICDLKNERKKAVLCILVGCKGSSPGKIGAKMLVYEEGKILGTIGGGSLEYQVIDEAVKLSGQAKCFVKKYNLSQDLAMICGGEVYIYFEVLNSPFKLFIFGAGHIGLKLANFAVQFGFETTVIDDRAQIFDDDAWQNCRTLNLPFLEAFQHLSFDERTLVCILTYQHAYDLEILAECIAKPYSYLGMIASKAKAEKAREYLRNKEVPEHCINLVDMPMGIPMNCQTPEEIAVSIIARLIDVRNNIS